MVTHSFQVFTATTHKAKAANLHYPPAGAAPGALRAVSLALTTHSAESGRNEKGVFPDLSSWCRPCSAEAGLPPWDPDSSRPQQAVPGLCRRPTCQPRGPSPGSRFRARTAPAQPAPRLSVDLDPRCARQGPSEGHLLLSPPGHLTWRCGELCHPWQDSQRPSGMPRFPHTSSYSGYIPMSAAPSTEP